MPQFREQMQMPEGFHQDGDAEYALSSLHAASTTATPTGLVPVGLSSVGLSASVSSVGLFPGGGSDVASPMSPSTPMLLLGMRDGVPGEEVSATLVQTHAQMPEAQEPACNDPYGSDKIGSPLQGIYEVETLLKMRVTADGKREFLIKWRGWGPSWNNWEPEENILDRRLLRKFNKKRPVDAVSSQDVNDFTMQSQRRCAKQAAVRARLAVRKEHEEEEKEDI